MGKILTWLCTKISKPIAKRLAKFYSIRNLTLILINYYFIILLFHNIFLKTPLFHMFHNIYIYITNFL
jgi:hypothetical protein